MAKFPFSSSRAALTVPKNMGPGGPTIRRGQANQAAETPWAFIRAVERRFGPIYADLACTVANMRAERGLCLDENTNSLSVDWAKYLDGGLGWDNPPFARITPWARHHAEQAKRGARTLLLVPASVGADWYWTCVRPFADVLSIGRLVFDNCYNQQGELITDPYPKDLILCRYDLAENTGSRRMEDWRKWQ